MVRGGWRYSVWYCVNGGLSCAHATDQQREITFVMILYLRDVRIWRYFRDYFLMNVFSCILAGTSIGFAKGNAQEEKEEK